MPIRSTSPDGFRMDALGFLEALTDWYDELPHLALDDLRPGDAALLIVDMIHGFTDEGALASPRCDAIVPTVAALAAACDARGIPVVVFTDAHGPRSPEFSDYPVHCVTGTRESEIVEPIAASCEYVRIPKNSTNGLLEPEFGRWLERNENVRSFVVAGCCTDICVQQLSVSLKCWFNRCDLRCRIVVPDDAADTYDSGAHVGDLMHLVALRMMSEAGVEVVKALRH